MLYHSASSHPLQSTPATPASRATRPATAAGFLLYLYMARKATDQGNQLQRSAMPRLRLGGDVVLRPLNEEDAGVLLEVIERNRERLRRWLSWLDDHGDIEDIESLIANHGRDFARGRSVRLGIEHRDQVAGIIGLQRINHADRTASLGYWLDVAHEGQGVVTRAAAAMCRYGIEQMGLGRIEIAAATDNTRSIAVAERLGFRFEGILRCREWLYDHYVDHAVYSLTRTDPLPRL